MRKLIRSLVLLFAVLGTLLASPYKASIQVTAGRVEVEVAIEEGNYLYADQFKVTDGLGHEQTALQLPDTSAHEDPLTGDRMAVYTHSFTAVYNWQPEAGGAGRVRVAYQGCSEQGMCFRPETVEFALDASESTGNQDASDATVSGDWEKALENFTVAGNKGGYMNAEDFLAFLDQSESGAVDSSTSNFERHGITLVLLFILLGGLALNLTPCVLPMIPVNLAIIGAGAQAGSKQRGFALGGVYGLGIALAYGVLGVVVVLTGSNFGTLQANPWFNLGIGLIFVVLALAMFDVLQIDFSRFQTKFGQGPQKAGRFGVAFVMGVVAALLAGACVAPVVTSVILFSGEVYQTSKIGGLLLPFVLGLGMALPWPFAGAGLSFLPKPGKWMQYVKYVFGVGILILAVYYGHLSYSGFQKSDPVDGIDGRTNAGLAAALNEAHRSGKTVLLDVTASWCKNCHAMEKGTFSDSKVQTRLEKYVVLKYVSEDPVNPNTQAVWKRFEVVGPPAFIVLKPQL